MSLVQSVLEGNRLALSRTLTLVENDQAEGRVALSELFPHTGRAHLVGVTGAPGTGKSSLVNMLAQHYRHPTNGQEPKKIAVVAVDPSSPFTGGAILGDRIRMRDLAGDPGVFIRSMAARGSLGGLASATAGLVQVFDAAGFDIVLIETVGAGQSEVEIVRLAHTTLVVEAPGMGDDIQAIKAGILEIADLLIVNKADRPGVENTERALRSMLDLAHPTRRGRDEVHHGRLYAVNAPASGQAEGRLWIPPILRAISTEGKGIPEIAAAIEKHRLYLESTGERQRRDRQRLEFELNDMVREALMKHWLGSLSQETYQQVFEALVERRISPHQALHALLYGKETSA
jgi:LAO/AO transport system kinase